MDDTDVDAAQITLVTLGSTVPSHTAHNVAQPEHVNALTGRGVGMR